MVKAVFIQSSHSKYDDRPGKAYHFPKRSYLRRVEQTVGDWVVFYESRQGGGRGYIGVQRVRHIEDDQSDSTHAYAILDQGSEFSFEVNVPRLQADGSPYETGLPIFGGFNTQAVRLISDSDFEVILTAGFSSEKHPDMLPRTDEYEPEFAGFSDVPSAFEHNARDAILVSRKFRDRSFAKQVKHAYKGICAISGIELRNGGGRPEVEAAHILPVSENGPDTIKNGLALSGTVHWMFDRGLLSISDSHEILIARDAVEDRVLERLVVPDRRLILPENPNSRPHSAYLSWHRDNVFKG